MNVPQASCGVFFIHMFIIILILTPRIAGKISTCSPFLFILSSVKLLRSFHDPLNNSDRMGRERARGVAFRPTMASLPPSRVAIPTKFQQPLPHRGLHSSSVHPLRIAHFAKLLQFEWLGPKFYIHLPGRGGHVQNTESCASL